MLFQSTTFACDAMHCERTFTSLSRTQGNATAYLELVEHQWLVERRVERPWQHFCPQHRAKESR